MYNIIKKKPPRLKTPARIGLATIAIMFSFITYERAQVWTNSAALWSDVIKTYPFPPWTIEVAYENRGDYYAKEHNELDKGLADYSTILLMRTTNYNIYKNIGNIYGLKVQKSAKAGYLPKAKTFTHKPIDAFTTTL